MLTVTKKNHFLDEKGEIKVISFFSSGKMELSSEMVKWALKFLKKQNVHQCIFMTKGYSEVRSRCMQIVWEHMDVIHYLDLTRLQWHNADRRPKRIQKKGVKRKFRPKTVYPMGYF